MMRIKVHDILDYTYTHKKKQLRKALAQALVRETLDKKYLPFFVSLMEKRLPYVRMGLSSCDPLSEFKQSFKDWLAVGFCVTPELSLSGVLENLKSSIV